MRARRHNRARQAIAILGLSALIAGTLQLMVAPAAYAATIVTDEFANLSAWTATRITIDTTIGSPAAPSARAAVTSQSASAWRNLPTTTMTPCMSANVNRTSGAADLLRMRTAANGAVIKAVVLANGNLQLRSDFGSTTINSNVPIGTGWHNIELCGTVGTNTTWDLFRDGTEIVSDWVANTGTTPVGRIQIGDTAAKTFTINFDHVVLDEAVGDGGTPGDTTPPTTPGQPSGASPTPGLIQIGWTASTDASLPLTYRVFRDGGASQVGSTTSNSFTDTGLTPGTSHTYRVQAVDTANNVSALSPVSASITVATAAPVGQPVPGHTRVGYDVPRTNTPLVTTGDITDLEYIGNRVFVAGTFTSVQNRGTSTTTYNQPSLFSFNITTGLVDANFRPTFAGGRVQEVEASPDGTKLFIVGTFNTVNGVTKRKIASINPVTGATVLGFTANANSQATSVDATNTTVYVGGQFTTVNGVPRGALASLNATTGQVVSGFVNNITGGIGTNGTLRVHAIVLTHDESKLLVVHTGRQINGQDRYGMGLIDTQTNQLLPWRSRLWDDNLQFVGGVTRIVAGAIAPDDSYFVVSSGAGGDRPPISDTVVAYPLEGGDNVQPMWISRMFDSVYSLAVSEVAVYAGGHFNYNESPTAPDPWPGLDNVGYGRGQGLAGYGLGDDIVIRDHVGAIDPLVGKSMDWNPGSNSYEGNQAMLVMPRGVITGGDGNTQGGLNGGRIAVYDFNDIPAIGNNDSVIINPIEGRVEESDVEFVVDGTATAASGVQRVEVMLRERDTNQYLQDNMTWGNASNTINANLASPGATSTTWSLPLTIAENHRILLYSRTFGNNGTSEPTTARPLQRIETFGTSDQTPTTNITGPNTSIIPTTTFIVTGTASDDFGVNSITVSMRDPQNRYLQGDGSASANYNTFQVTPDVVGATSATWQWEVTVPYEGEWEAGAVAVDTEGQSDLREGVRTWIVSDTAVPPTVDIATPAVMIPPVTIPALTMAPGSPVTFSGSATDDEGLHDVTITLRNTATGENLAADGTWGVNVNAGSHRISPLDIAGTSYNWSYTTPFNLTSGTYVFSVSATDDLGLNTSNANRGSLTINVQVPGDAFPDVTINPTGTINGVQVLHLDLAGTATDDIGVSAVRVRIEEDDTSLYLQANGSLAAAIAYLDATMANPGATSTTWTLSVDLPVEGDYRVTVVAWDTSNQQDPSTTGATSRYPIYPGDLPPTVTEALFSPEEGTAFIDGRIFTSGRVEDDQQIAQAQVAIRNALGQYMSSSGAFSSTILANSWRNAFLNSPGSPGSNFSYTTPVIPPGSYTVFGRGVDQNGFTTPVPIERNVTVTGSPTSLPPVANFTYSCVANVCSFDGRSSTDETIPTLTYSWNFGNGSGSGPVPIRTYTSPGTFTVTLTVRDENGLSGVTSQIVTIVEPPGNLPPVPVISPPVCTARLCNFSSASSTDPNTGDSFTRLWNFGDGTTSTSTSTSKPYAADGTYTVTLFVTDGWGDVASTTVTVTIAEPAGNQPPTAVISAPVCIARTCNFFGTASSDPNSDAMTYSWNWGDGTAVGTGATPTAHTFAANQAYTVTLTVTDAWGDVGTDTEVVTFSIPAGNQPPNVVIGTPSCVVRTCTIPSAGSSDPDGDSFTYSWTWGDATANTTTAIGSHTYTADNTYLVRLTLTDVWGAVAFAEVSVTVGEPAGNLPPNPVIGTPVCTARTCAFSATGSTDPDGDAFTYLWNWGDATATSTAASPSHTYLLDGTYTVSLTLTDAWGDANTVTRDVTITEPATNVAPVPIINPVTCVVRTCTFYGISSYEPNSDAFTYLWTFGSGTTTATTVSPPFTYPADGTYTVTLTVTDAWGDAAVATRQVVIGEPAGNLPPVPVMNPVTCVALACTFSSVGTVDPNGDTLTYLWNFGDGTTNTTANPSKSYLLAGTYNVTLTVTDGWGDAASATPRVVTITEPATNVPPVPVIVNPPSCVALVCTFSSAGSADPNGDAFTRVWAWGDTTPNTTSTTVTQAHTFPAAGTYTVTLTLTDWWGDANFTTRVVTVT